MENGIGRAGYRLLALVFLALGLLGLGLQWADGGAVTQWIGVTTTTAGLGVLAALAFILTGSAPMTVPEEPSGIDYEFSDPVSVPAPAPVPVQVPTPPVVEMVAKAPERRPQVQPGLSTLRDRYTQDTPMVREILTPNGKTQHQAVPEVTARRVPKGARPEQAPSGTSIGRCGSCNTIVYAPTTRPLRLRCPACSKVTLLK